MTKHQNAHKYVLNQDLLTRGWLVSPHSLSVVLCLSGHVLQVQLGILVILQS